jgi:hypothetical protein
VTNPVEKLARTWSAAETCGRAPLPPLRRAAFPPRLVLAARQERAAGAPTFPQPLAEPQSPSAQTLAPDSPPRRATPRPDITPVTAWIDFPTEEGSGYCFRRQAEKWIEETLRRNGGESLAHGISRSASGQLQDESKETP